MTDHKPIKPPDFGGRMADPDFVDRVWLYILANFPDKFDTMPPEKVDEFKQMVRKLERRERPRISTRTPAGVECDARMILRMFNGRNASEVARVIGCSRAKVYRVLKQSGI